MFQESRESSGWLDGDQSWPNHPCTTLAHKEKTQRHDHPFSPDQVDPPWDKLVNPCKSLAVGAPWADDVPNLWTSGSPACRWVVAAAASRWHLPPLASLSHWNHFLSQPQPQPRQCFSATAAATRMSSNMRPATLSASASATTLAMSSPSRKNKMLPSPVCNGSMCGLWNQHCG